MSLGSTMQVFVTVILSAGLGFTTAAAYCRDGSGRFPASLARGLRASNQKLTVDEDLTPLMQAVRDQEGDTVKELLGRSPDLNAKDQEGWTALTYAALNEDSSILKALIDEGADVNLRDNHGMTPLIHAAVYGHVSIAKLLLDRGADVNAEDDRGETALTLAERRKSRDLIKLFEQAGGVNPLARAQATAPPAEDQAVGDTRPVLLNRLRPEYTEKARKNKISGIVRMRLLIGQDGSIKKMRAVTGLPDGLTYQAYKAAYQMRFRPATKDGQPVDFWQIIEVEFNTR
jgi:TonB family protein